MTNWLPCMRDCFYQYGGICRFDCRKPDSEGIYERIGKSCPYFIPKADGCYLPPARKISRLSVQAR